MPSALGTTPPASEDMNMTRIGSIGAAFGLGSILGIVLGSSLLCESPSEEMSVPDSTISRTPGSIPIQAASVLPKEIESPFEFASELAAAEPERTTDAKSMQSSVAREPVVATTPSSTIGAIEGRVTDPQGTPVPGATVRARWMGPDDDDRVLPASTRGLAAPSRKDFEGAMAAAREAFLSEQASLLEAVTDDEGRYRVETTRTGSYELDAWAEGWVVRAYPRSETRVPSNNDVNFVASRAVELPIVVRQPDGSLAERAYLTFESVLHRDWFEATWTPASPTLRVSMDQYRIRARAKWRRAGEDGSEIDLHAEPVVFDLTTHGAASPLELTLVPTSGIRGHVRLPSSEDNEYAIVRAVQVAPGREVDREALRDADDHCWVGFDFPEYSFEDLTPGRYCVAAFLDGVESPLSESYVDVLDGMEQLDFDLTEVATQAGMRTITATVFSPNQERMSRVEFQVAFVTQDGAIDEVRDVDELTAPSGEITVLVDDSLAKILDDPLSSTRATLVASTIYFGSTGVALDRTTKHVELRFQDPAKLEVRIVGSSTSGSAAYSRVSVSSVDPAIGAVDDRSQYVRGDGTTDFSGFGPGEYLVAVHSNDSRDGRSRKLVEQRVTLSAGSNRVVVALPPLSTLTIEIPGAETGSVVLHSELFGDEEVAITSGTARIEALPPGHYVIRYEGELGERRIELDLNDSMTVSLPEPVSTEPPQDS